MMQNEAEADVAIVGAGPAGALFAHRLSAAGKRVVVLDAGPGWDLSDLQSSQIWSRRLKWGGAPVEAAGAERAGHNFAVGWGLGGSAMHHYAGYPRLQAADFTMHADHGIGRDWPWSYDTLRPWYDRVQAEIGLSGDAAGERWRPPGAPYPLPPLPAYAQGRMLSAGFAKLGLHVSAAPLAILSQAYKGRPGCLNDGWCDAGCPIGALYNPLLEHLPSAIKAGATVTPGACVTSIETDAKGRAVALIWRDKAGGEHRQPATMIVLAAAAVGNARLLLASVSAKHPHGFGNANGQVGRGYNVHAVGNVNGLFARETECWRGVTAGSLTCQDGYAKERPAGEGFGSLTWGIGPAVKPNDLLGIAMTRPELHGNALHAFMHRAARHLGVVSGIVENVPRPENRIELTNARDRFGMPMARTVHARDPRSVARYAAALKQGEAVLHAAGADEVWCQPAPAFAHPAGGTAMGIDPATSVTDGYGRLHEADNVFVAGGGLFPTIGAVSPTFTILAMADRTTAMLTGANR